MFININKAGEDDYFKQQLIDALKIIIVIEYIMNFCVFSLWIELLLVPVFTILWGMAGVASVYSEYKSVESILNNIIGALGLGLIVITGYNIVTDYKDILIMDNLFEFLNPIVLTLLILPLIYIFGLWISYETLFLRMKYIIKTEDVRYFARRKTLTSFHFNLNGLKRWSKMVHLLNLESNEDVKKGIRDTKYNSA